MGRPPGAHSGTRRRAYPQDWELRDPARYGERLEELESEADDGQGIVLDPRDYAMRDAARRGLASDASYFDGYDLRQGRRSAGREMFGARYNDYLSEEEDYKDYKELGHPRPRSRRQESLLHSALDRIARARADGKGSVNLTNEEMEALERRDGQQPEPISPLLSPPATPAKSKLKATNRNNSTGSLSGKTRKRSSSGYFSSPAKSNSKAKISRRSSPEKATAPPAGHVMVQGPDGMPFYAPIYYPPPSPEQMRLAQVGPRSSSKHSRRESTPPDQLPLPSPPPRYYSGPVRPESQRSARSFEDDRDRYLPLSHTHSAPHAPAAGYRLREDYDAAPTLPAAQDRRHVSGPPDVRYASLRRIPPSSPLAQRAMPTDVSGSSLRRVETSGSSSSDDNQGVQVDIVPDEHGGYSIRNSPAQVRVPEAGSGSATVTKAGNEPKKRKSRR